MEYEHLLLDRQLCFPLWAAARKVTGLYRPVLEPLGLTYTQYIVLLALWEKDGISVREIGERLFLDSGTLTPLLKKLEAQGRVVRTRSTDDERVVLVRLTDEGRALRERASHVPFDVGSCVTLPADDAIQLHRILHALLSGDLDVGCERAGTSGAD